MSEPDFPIPEEDDGQQEDSPPPPEEEQPDDEMGEAEGAAEDEEDSYSVDDELSPDGDGDEDMVAQLQQRLADAEGQIQQILAWLFQLQSDKTGGGISWGKVASAWTNGTNTITLTPCQSQTDSTVTGEPNVTATLFSPSGALPVGYKFTVGDILAYVPLADDGTGIPKGILLPIVTGITASPTTIGSSSEGSDSADTGTWSQSGTKTPVDIYVCGRVEYDDAGDETLYGYARKLSFDGTGRLVTISAETRYTIDVPDACP